jgi:hypothetical protein
MAHCTLLRRNRKINLPLEIYATAFYRSINFRLTKLDREQFQIGPNSTGEVTVADLKLIGPNAWLRSSSEGEFHVTVYHQKMLPPNGRTFFNKTVTCQSGTRHYRERP